jgi:hypothetical protein
VFDLQHALGMEEVPPRRDASVGHHERKPFRTISAPLSWPLRARFDRGVSGAGVAGMGFVTLLPASLVRRQSLLGLATGGPVQAEVSDEGRCVDALPRAS